MCSFWVQLLLPSMKTGDSLGSPLTSSIPRLRGQWRKVVGLDLSIGLGRPAYTKQIPEGSLISLRDEGVGLEQEVITIDRLDVVVVARPREASVPGSGRCWLEPR